nr:PREDICTED: uncharacterized protein LOC105662586 [Megachile rotundata]
MLKLFSLDLWHAILWMYFLISACSYVSETVGTILTHQKYEADLSDHLFYNFGMIYCDQSYLPDSSSISSCIVELCLGIFSLLIRTAFGAFVFEYLSQITASPPFDDVDTLLERTAYNVVAVSGSVHEQVLKRNPIFGKVYDMNRYVIVPTIEDLYTTGCSTRKKYAILQAEDRKKAAGLFICPLTPVGPHVFESWITSGVARNFEYWKTVDLIILKLHEGGIIKLLRERWIESKNVEEKFEPGVEPINMTEVYLVLIVFGIGWLITLLVFMLENMIYIYFNEQTDISSLEKSKVKPTRRRTKRIGLFNQRSNTFRGY